jgi:hypothetical protein
MKMQNFAKVIALVMVLFSILRPAAAQQMGTASGNRAGENHKRDPLGRFGVCRDGMRPRFPGVVTPPDVAQRGGAATKSVL